MRVTVPCLLSFDIPDTAVEAELMYGREDLSPAACAREHVDQSVLVEIGFDTKLTPDWSLAKGISAAWPKTDGEVPAVQHTPWGMVRPRSAEGE